MAWESPRLICVWWQLFWEKKLSGLNAFDIAEELVKTMDLPKGLQGDVPQGEQGDRGGTRLWLPQPGASQGALDPGDRTVTGPEKPWGSGFPAVAARAARAPVSPRAAHLQREVRDEPVEGLRGQGW